MRCSRRGFNLIESAIVLGVVGLVIGGIWVAAASLNQSLKVSRTTSALLVAVNRLRNVVPGSMATGPYVGFDYTFLIGANIFPDDFVSNGATLTPWGTNIVAGVTGTGSTAYLQLIVEVPDKATCLQMTSSLTGRFKNQDDLAYVIVGPPYTTFSTWPLFVNGTHCDGVSFPTYLSFMFTFGRVN